MDFSVFLQPFVDLFNRWRVEQVDNRREVKADMERALEALGKALMQTRIYLHALEQSGKVRDREIELAELWRQASLALRNVNIELARRAAEKMDYWLTPESWTQDDIERHGIDIDVIFDRYADLLAPAAAKHPRAGESGSTQAPAE